MENTRIVARTRRFTVFHNEERGRLVACCMVCHYSVPIQNFDYFSSEYHKIMHILLKDRQTVTYIASFTKVSIRCDRTWIFNITSNNVFGPPFQVSTPCL
jgi:hypothetical protein